eukprot:431390_1
MPSLIRGLYNKSSAPASYSYPCTSTFRAFHDRCQMLCAAAYTNHLIPLVILAHPHSAVHFMINVKCYVLLLYQSMAYTNQLFGVCFAYHFMVPWHVACVFELLLFDILLLMYI